MRDEFESVEIDLVVVGFVARVLHNAVVGANCNETDVVEITLAPVPLVESFKMRQCGAHQFHIAGAEEDALHSPGDERRLRICGKGLPVFTGKALRSAVGGDEVSDHAVGVVGLGCGPALLRVPVVLIDAADKFLLIGNDGEQIGEEGGVPYPLAYVNAAGNEPWVLEWRLGGLHASEDAVLIDIDGEGKHRRVVSLKQWLEELLDLLPR